jgi:hypothetical protein
MRKRDHYLFWIKSSRGTDYKTVYAFKAGTPLDYVKQVLEEWCSKFAAWHVSDNHVRYGYKKVKMPGRRELIKQYHKVCDRKYSINDKCATVAAMLSPRNHE